MKLTRFWRIDWKRVDTRWLPFADAASAGLPLSRLIRLSLFQVSVGMATALMVGTLNRVMIVELGVHAWVVAAMVALPLLIAPFRALIGYRSDTHRSVLGWRRVPFIWIGTIMQFGGLAIMPFALILLSGDSNAPEWVGTAAAALAFLLAGAGLQTTQTAGLALATDLADEPTRPRVVALLYVMLLVGMVISALVFGVLLEDFTQVRLIQVVQGAAALTIPLNLIALWKQEPRDRSRAQRAAEAAPDFRTSWKVYKAHGRVLRFLTMVGLGTAAFAMQDVILEPYGGEILHLPVGSTTTLTAMMSMGALAAFAWSARKLATGTDPYRLTALGALVGIVAFSAVIFAEPLESATLFRIGTVLIGFGNGLFAVATLTAAMSFETQGLHGLALGAWGAVQATANGLAVLAGGAIRDAVSTLATQGVLGAGLEKAATGYSFVYHVEMYLLFATLIAVGPLVRASARPVHAVAPGKFGLADLPG